MSHRKLILWVLFIVFASAVACRGESTMPRPLTICEILASPGVYDEKTVSVSASVSGDRHSVILEGLACHDDIYLVHKWGQEGVLWKALDDALVRKRTGLDKRTLRVRVIGVFHGSVPIDDRHVKQFEVTSVIEVKFDDDAKGPGNRLDNPSASTLLHESGHVDLPKLQ